MFSFNAVVLKKIQVKDSKNIISLFSQDYWKISVWMKESKNRSPVDIGNIYNFSSKSENGINNIDSYKAKIVINSSLLWFKEINNILRICAYFEKILPASMLFESIFNDYSEAIPYLEQPSSNDQMYHLFLLRFVKKLWIAQTPGEEAWTNIKKLFSVIDSYPLGSIIKIQWISPSDYREIEDFIYATLHNYMN
ncbi:MAG: hypothetical protein ACD_2C00033G0002 [uncultured bacterium (gcode 4)]|uniref:DNA replication/recombination mediator RecO N-terminal domain-containing protein n=1 Tax=uncultured bacterium (gcode 4) TaxID=1234023 RepID=K2FGC2_9BACT|nr:MAG: hypothetical protein ACD_2C00033G0002 [uncultured bacterium (gcode 4)]